MKRRDLRVPAVVLATTLALSCGAARAFLDLPPPEDEPEPVLVARPQSSSGPASSVEEMPPPPIEAIPVGDSVLDLLPRDRAGGVDWVGSVADGIIRPRPRLPGAVDPPEPESGYDFYLKGAGPEAYFPHSTHTYWVGCQSCHPAIYRYRGDAVSTKPGHAEDSCGACHGKVAFSAQACERCHAEFGAMMPADRLPPLTASDALILRQQSPEVIEDSTAAPGEMPPSEPAQAEPAEVDPAEAEPTPPALDPGSLYPSARFDHWVHRIRYRCKACHPQTFTMRLGGTGLTQELAHGSSKCGRCHNGAAAFPVDVNDCDRCHRTEPAEPP
jgi:c(7)-type cytochrome triheme protein